MNAICPRLFRAASALAILAAPSILGIPRAALAGDEGPGATSGGGPLVVDDRAISLERGEGLYWQVDYRLRNDGPALLVLEPEAIRARVEGWVSNSRVGEHAAPRRVEVVLAGPSAFSGAADVILSPDDSRRCRELATLQVWTGSTPPDGAAPDASAASSEPLRVAPGAVLHARLVLEHDHFLHGPYTALLGVRSLELVLGPATIRDTLPLDREGRVARAVPDWYSPPPPERRDARVWVSAPDSLHLTALDPGRRSYRFDGPVRYGTRMRLRFWYLIAPGTESECRMRLVQYRDAPSAWRTLSDGRIDRPLTTDGRWVRVEQVILTEPDATSLSLEFRVLGGEAGDLWIDDVSLEPVGQESEGP